MTAVHTIVSCQWLKEQLDEKTNDIVIADVSRYRSSNNARQDYLCDHIPGAVFLDLFANVELTPSKPWNLATAEQFESSVRDVGINNNSSVILYSTTDKCGYFLSARAWWMFQHFGHTNVCVLDGGFAKWVCLGYPVSAEVPTLQVGNFVASVQKDDIVDFEGMRLAVKKGQRQICDSRSSSRYLGVDSPGHIPTAINIPADVLVDADEGLLRSTKQLHHIFVEAGVDLSKSITTYCNSGMSSCLLALAAHLCGAEDIAVYLDGFLDWHGKAHPDDVMKEKRQ